MDARTLIETALAANLPKVRAARDTAEKRLGKARMAVAAGEAAEQALRDARASVVQLMRSLDAETADFLRAVCEKLRRKPLVFDELTAAMRPHQDLALARTACAALLDGYDAERPKVEHAMLQDKILENDASADWMRAAAIADTAELLAALKPAMELDGSITPDFGNNSKVAAYVSSLANLEIKGAALRAELQKS